MSANVNESVEMGFDSKISIHPKQNDTTNKAFQYVDIEYMKTVVEAYEKQETAVFMYDGKAYEKCIQNVLIELLENIVGAVNGTQRKASIIKSS